MKHLDILLVDDDQNDCALFGIAIGKTDLDICLQIVTGGEQAIDYLEGHGVYVNRSFHPMPALVLLDLDLRLTGGLELLDWRRASASFSSLPVVIFSEFAYKGTIETALAMGASTFIAKPFEFDGWKAVVRQIWELGMKWSQPPTPASASTPGQAKPSNCILVVDDDICIREVSVSALTASGYRVDTAGDGETAWEMLQGNTYDLLITDNNMPAMSGLELVKKLRSAHLMLPVVLASGSIPTEALGQNASLQVAATLPKPFTMGELLATVKKALCSRITSMEPLDIDSQQCTCCGERISTNRNGLSRDSTICASCSSLLDGMEDRDQLELPEQVGNIRRSKPKGNTGTQPGVAMG